MTKKYKKNLIKAARAGGKILKKYFGKALNITEKSTLWDFQTKADLNSEKAILKILKTEFPTSNIYSEEKGKINNKSHYTIVVDPLDGTNNFVMGIPSFCISIAILKNNEAVAGVLYQPILNQVYYAEKGKGAFLNDKKIKVNNITNRKKLTIAYNCGYLTKRNYIAELTKVLVNADHKRILRNWCPTESLYLLASGKIESVIGDRNEIYDFAAGKLIAMEAGAKIIDLKGNKDTNYINDKFIISNHEQTNKYIFSIIKLLQKMR